MNLLYIRAAIQAATGVTLSQDEILVLLVEEGLLTPSEASQDGLVFRGYAEFFHTDTAEARMEPLTALLDIRGSRHEEDPEIG